MNYHYRYIQLLAALAAFTLMLAMTSCSSSRHITRSTSTVDSTWQNERKALLEVVDAQSRKIEGLTLDSQAVVIEFDTLKIHDTVPVIQFLDGKPIYVKGPVRRILVKDTHSETFKDSMTVAYNLLKDSLTKEQGNIKTVDKTVTKHTRSGFPWFWLIVGIIAGWLLRHKGWALSERLFGWKGKKEINS